MLSNDVTTVQQTTNPCSTQENIEIKRPNLHIDEYSDSLLEGSLEQLVFWKKSLVNFPSGSLGKQHIGEITRLINESMNQTAHRRNNTSDQ